MASKRRNMFHKNKTQETTEKGRISDVTTANAGIYRCSARTTSGYLEDDYILNVQGYTPLADDSEAIETKRASVGQTAILNCNTDLERPVSYSWSKRDAPLPEHSSSYFETLTIPNVTLADAGMYICTASNGEVRMDIPTILTVTGSIPFFAQAPKSYIALPQLLNAYLVFNIELIIKPEHRDGLILYNGQQSDGAGDFVSFGLRDGVPEFRFDVGSGPAIISSDEPLQMGVWHHIKLKRDRRDGYMWVNEVGPYTGSSSGRYQGLDLNQPLYVGSVPDFSKIHTLAGFDTGFVGCVSKVKVDEEDDFSQRKSLEWVGVTTCETCPEGAGNPCSNNGVCQEAVNTAGYVCICPRGFSGVNCTQAGEPCFPGACGSGHCNMSPPSSSVHCECPLGKAGPRCEHDVHITTPMFTNNAYIAYPTPRSGDDRMMLTMKVNAADDSDGLLLYSSQTTAGQGDFVSLAIKDRRFEFKFDPGTGPITLTSNREVIPGEWVTVIADRDARMATLSVGSDVVQMTLTPSQRQGLNLRTPLYMGGHDRSVSLNSAVRIDKGFEGCISQIDVYGMSLDLLRSAVNASNVGECQSSHSDPCLSAPCHNGGSCVPPKRPGHSGTNCEIETDQCEEIAPCENGGTCIPQSRGYLCHCPLGFAGEDCEQTVEISYDVSLSGNGYVELDKELLPHTEVDALETIEMDFTSSSPDGLLFWHGQPLRHDSSREPDYFAIAIVDGEVEVSYELGSGPGHVRVPHRIDDGKRHHLKVTREGSDATVTIDSTHQESAHSSGVLTQLNAKGNIYIGGTPNNDIMTDGRYQHSFTGCIHRLRIQDSGDIEFGNLALSSTNALSCTNKPRSNDITDNYEDDDDGDENGDEEYTYEGNIDPGRQPIVN
ncbi:hypothetical protein AAG570_005175 [Ranatra chinensis]|uniref:Basement membrane-specific heparan sulfate proteoglycan core protein n=1 Tax=Ranatra chinensis TaxID=642074 RepID=A0ABD0YCE8_9HEMI